jgi:hypothetical protein
MAAFGSTNMTIEWRRRILGMPEGVPGAYCICRLHRGMQGLVGQIEPIGLLPEYQGRARPRPLLVEGLRRMYTHGAHRAHRGRQPQCGGAPPVRA